MSRSEYTQDDADVVSNSNFYSMPDGWSVVDGHGGYSAGCLYERGGLQVMVSYEEDASHDGRELGDWLVTAGRFLMEYDNDDRRQRIGVRCDDRIGAEAKAVELMGLIDMGRVVGKAEIGP